LYFLIGIGEIATIMTLCVARIWGIFDDRLPIAIYPGDCVLSPAKFEKCVLTDMKINETSVSSTLSVDERSISMLLSLKISAFLCVSRSVHSVHFGIEPLWWHITVQATLTGVNQILGVCWLPHQPSHAFDDVSTPVLDRALVIMIPSHVLERVEFRLPESQIISHASPERLDTITVFEAWAMQSGVLFLQHVVRVRLHAHHLNPRLDIFVLSTRSKLVVEIVL
jgi:hypothetical protein